MTKKIHAVVDANGLPIRLKRTPGQADDGKSTDDMLATVKAGDTLIADAVPRRANLTPRIASGRIVTRANGMNMQ